ncbi:MAG: hypothetical protein ACRD03_04585 [Acidimicrobiales bacterium]
MQHESIGKIRFGTALLVATTFKVLAVLSLLGGFILALSVAGSNDLSSAEDETVTISAVVASTFVSAALLSFFAYVLGILVEIYEQVWHTRYAAADLADDEDKDGDDE